MDEKKKLFSALKRPVVASFGVHHGKITVACLPEEDRTFEGYDVIDFHAFFGHIAGVMLTLNAMIQEQLVEWR